MAPVISHGDTRMEDRWSTASITQPVLYPSSLVSTQREAGNVIARCRQPESQHRGGPQHQSRTSGDARMVHLRRGDGWVAQHQGRPQHHLGPQCQCRASRGAPRLRPNHAEMPEWRANCQLQALPSQCFIPTPRETSTPVSHKRRCPDSTCKVWRWKGSPTSWGTPTPLETLAAGGDSVMETWGGGYGVGDIGWVSLWTYIYGADPVAWDGGWVGTCGGDYGVV
ncbi:hypothetical protein HOY82DRAFT_113025 [Tuber indicum]|nr:hypothetical protein HOY82DRAFT_113025 [Tuber indicum]